MHVYVHVRIYVVADLVDLVPVDVTVKLGVQSIQHAHHVHWGAPGDGGGGRECMYGVFIRQTLKHTSLHV